MSGSVLLTLLSDCLLAMVLFVLFWYVARVSRNVQGILTWGSAHLVYTLGATIFDAGTTLALDNDLQATAHATAHLGSLILCMGMAGLGWAVVLFVRRRPLHRGEFAMIFVAAAIPLATWLLGGDWNAQSVALNLVELLVLLWMCWHLRDLHEDPYRLPARMMMVGCVLLALLYGSVIPGWSLSQYGFDEIWVNVDLSIWFMLNFCMLMLCSFRAAESLKLSAMFDPLTGALNRRGLNAELAALPDRRGAGMSVIAIDLDHFKAINDFHGHDAGDRVLQRFSDLVRANLRDDALFARMGGEEFAVVLSEGGADAARRLAERLRALVQKMEFHAASGPSIRVTVSLGVATRRDPEQTFADLMRCADEALYAAKHAGRNRVAFFD